MHIGSLNGGLGVERLPIEVSGAERARWLAELSVAIEEAQRLLWRLGVSEGDSSAAKELYGRLELARAETEWLRLRGLRRVTEDFTPDWTELMSSTGLFDAAG